MSSIQSAAIVSSVKQNRKGVFKIKSNLFFNESDIVFKILSSVLVLKTEHDFVYEKITYYCYSPIFDIVPEGSIVPEYIVEFNKDENAAITFTFKRAK